MPANLTRVGVLVYSREDGSKIRELRHPDEVFAADSLSTLAGAPVTDLHPTKPVRPSNWREVSVGHVGDEVKEDGKFVAASLTIQDESTIVKIEHEDRSELSCGYSCQLDETPGDFEGERYDAIQRSIRYNHVALGPAGWGRAGNEVALRLDAQGNQITDNPADKPTKETVPMKIVRIDGVDYEVGSDAHINKLEEMNKAKLDAETSRADKLEAERDAVTKERDDLKTELDEANDPKRLDSLVAARVDLVTQAQRVLDDDVKLDGKTDREIMVETIKHDSEDFDPEGKSDDYVLAYFETTIQSSKHHDEGGKGIGAARSAVKGVTKREDTKRKDEGEVDRYDADAARQRMLDRNQEAATKPLLRSLDN